MIYKTGRDLHQRTIMYALPPNFESALPHMFVEQEEGFPTTLSGSEQLHTAMGSQRVLVGTAVQNYFKLQSLDDNFLLHFETTSQEANWFQTVKSIGWYSLYPYYNIWDIIWGDDTLIGISSAPRRFGIDSIEGLYLCCFSVMICIVIVSRLNVWCHYRSVDA